MQWGGGNMVCTQPPGRCYQREKTEVAWPLQEGDNLGDILHMEAQRKTQENMENIKEDMHALGLSEEDLFDREMESTHKKLNPLKKKEKKTLNGESK